MTIQQVMVKRSRWCLVGILAVAVLVRVGAALAMGDAVEALPGTYDQISYHTLSLRVLDGKGFSFGEDWWPITRAGEPTAHWSYLYTLYVAGVYSLFGTHPLAARLIQAVSVGVLHPWLSWRIGRRVFGERAGIAAAGLAAFYAYFVYYSGTLMTEVVFIMAILWMLDLATRIGNDPVSKSARGLRGRLSEWFQLGLAIALAALLRQVVLLFVPFLFLWLWWRKRGTTSVSATLAGIFTVCAVVAIAVLPWTMRNRKAFGRFVLLNTNAGYAFFWANHPIHGVDFMSILPSDGPSYQDLIPLELRSLDEAALDQALLFRGLSFVIDDPWRYVQLTLSRFKAYFKFWPAHESSALSNISRVASFGVCLPFMVYGLWLSTGRVPGRSAAGMDPSVVLLWLFAAVYSAIHLLSWALIRYRLPVDAVLLLFAGLAVSQLWQSFFSGRKLSEPG